MLNDDDFNQSEIFAESIEDLDIVAERLLKSELVDIANPNQIDNDVPDIVDYGLLGPPEAPVPSPTPQSELTQPTKSPGLSSRAIDSPPELSPSEGGLFSNLSPSGFQSSISDEDSSIPEPLDKQYQYREVIVDKNGVPRQAGSDTQEGEFIRRMRTRAEQSLFVFTKGILQRTFLTSHFHQDVCEFLQVCPPFRKLVLMPREHAKTTIVAGGLPAHILIQPIENNIYFPGLSGRECRILLSGETEKMAKKNLRVVKSVFDENAVFRAFWPNCVWPKGNRAREWSTEQIIIPRENEWPDPTIRAVGVGGAITGARPNVMIKDDLVSFKARNSEVVMNEAIEWHIASRALLDTYEVESGLQSLEFTIGTRWAVFDLYSYIIDNDPSVEVISEDYHRIIRDGKILWPEKHTVDSIEQLRLEHGSNFYLLYLNSAADPSLTDFDLELVRKFAIIGGKFVFDSDARDTWLTKRMERVFGKGPGEISTNVDSLPKRGEPFDLGRIAETMRGSGIRLIGGR